MLGQSVGDYSKVAIVSGVAGAIVLWPVLGLASLVATINRERNGSRDCRGPRMEATYLGEHQFDGFEEQPAQKNGPCTCGAKDRNADCRHDDLVAVS
ncbi:hypothetical protein [uncultured Enterovirga sp.]|uniref:hypothetical protein n=1 Tax=uncultured Enterovirga sp. TaxID=2026352 RepID=UPI0035CC5257